MYGYEDDYWYLGPDNDALVDGEPYICDRVGCTNEVDPDSFNAPYCGDAHRRECVDNADNYTGPTYMEYED